MTRRNRPTDPVLSEFIEVVGELTTDFTPHSEFRRFRIPQRPTPLDPICDHVGIDVGREPQEISRTLFMMEWNSLPGYSSVWQLYALRLPTGDRVYWVDDADGRKIIALGPGGVGADWRFVRVLFKDNGEMFGTGIFDSAPSRVFTNLRGERLIAAFLDAFYCAPNARVALDGLWRSAVRRWLKEVLTKGGKELVRPLTKAQRQEEFLRLAERVVTDFRPHPDDPQVRIAPRFTPTGPIAKFVGATRRRLPANISRGIIRFVWWGAPGSATSWEINAFDLPSGRSAYWIETDFGCEDENEKRYIFASGDSDERLIELFFASDGKTFGVDGPGGSPPMEVATNIPEGTFLIDVFTSLFTAAKSWSRIETKSPTGFDRGDPVEQRRLVEVWLEEALNTRRK